MRPVAFPAAALDRLRVATMDELVQALGGPSPSTVFRKLRAIGALSSYSHGGHYYTLRTTARFDADGLWARDTVPFSTHGTLRATALALTEASPHGWHAREARRAGRRPLAGHVAAPGGGRPAGLRRRRRPLPVLLGRPAAAAPAGERPVHRRAPLPLPTFMRPWLLVTTARRFFRMLDERQRRAGTGFISQLCGRGGDHRAAAWVGLHPKTVAKGRRELAGGRLLHGRVRRPGGGRKALAKNPALSARLRELLADDTAGSPMGGLRWMRRSVAKLAAQMTADGFPISASTVRRWLKRNGFSLRVNRKCLATTQHPDCDPQFQRIAALRREYAGRPVISVDTKKKELVGLFRNAGSTWQQAAAKVLDHDFRSLADGRAVPYGIYDLHANRGTVCVGDSADTPRFAVDCIETWWRTEGQARYPGATELLILADSGGSNGCRPRAWKHALQHVLCNRHGLRVRVAHYPSGCSKWNPIEHRLFSFLSTNWQGKPLDSFETVLNYIRTTTTGPGLELTAHRITRQYARGIRISDMEMDALALHPDTARPRWNYEIRPHETAAPAPPSGAGSGEPADNPTEPAPATG